VPPLPPRRSPCPPAAKVRKANAKREQADELDEEGLTEGGEETDGDTETPEASAADEDGTEEEGSEEAAASETDEKAADPASSLDPYLRFVAQNLGWNDAKINKLLKADPELAEQTFRSLADSYTAMSRQYAGVQAPQGTLLVPGTLNPQQPPAQATDPASRLDKFYSTLAAFKKPTGTTWATSRRP
jgi:hypothetical protein